MSQLYIPHAASIVTIRSVQGAEFLLQRRSEKKLKGVWNYVAGKIDAGENAVEAIQRELKEEVNLVANELYLADMNEVYYDRKEHAMRITPVFVAIVKENAEVELDLSENDQYEWLGLEDACSRLMPMQQEILHHVYKYFIQSKPNHILRIDKSTVDF